MSFDICEHFNQYFSLSIADNSSLLEEVYKIRYEVYCKELKYEPKEKFPDGMEKDCFDSHSIHCLLKHKPTNQYAGCMRIILPQPATEKPVFPWQQFSSKIVYPSPEFNLHNICEISRLAVRSQFRQRKGEEGQEIPGVFFNSSGGLRRFPLIAISLSSAAFCLALNLELNLVAIMEPRLARHLRGCGLHYCLVSELFEYHGKRGIFFSKPIELFESIAPDHYRFFNLLNSVIADGLINSGYISTPFAIPQLDFLNQLAYV